MNTFLFFENPRFSTVGSASLADLLSDTGKLQFSRPLSNSCAETAQAVKDSSLAAAIILKTGAAGKCFQGSLSGPTGPALGLAPVGAAETPLNTFPPSFTVFKMKAAVSFHANSPWRKNWMLTVSFPKSAPHAFPRCDL